MYRNKSAKYLILSIISIVFFIGSNFSNKSSLLHGQDENVEINQKLDFYLDYATFFKGTIGKSLIEIYIAVPMKSLTYNENLDGSFSVSVQIFDDKNKVVVEDYWGQKVKINSEEEKYSTSEFPAITKFNIASGIYRLLVEVKDLNSGVSAEIDIPVTSEKFVVKDYYKRIYEDKKVSISSIQLCSKLIKIDNTDNITNTEFSKNGLIVLPNPRKLYGTFRPFMDYMVELYGLEVDKKYYVKWNITDGDGFIVQQSEYKEKKSPGSTMVLTGRAKVHSLKTGSYNFQLFITENPIEIDDEDDIIATTVNNFFIFRKIDFTQKRKNQEIQGLINLDKDNIDNYDFTITLNDKQIENEFSIVYATLLHESEKKLAEKLNIDGKRNFLNKFWIEKEKKEKHSRSTFLSAVDYVNKTYSFGNKKGWEKDRGRIFLMAGKPDTQEAILSNQNKLDHEIWRYFKDNYIFVFLDKHGLSDFRLIHSNFDGEKQDPRWEEKLEKKMLGF